MDLLEKIFHKLSSYNSDNHKNLNTLTDKVNVLKQSDMVRVEGGKSNKSYRELSAWDTPCTVLPYQ